MELFKTYMYFSEKLFFSIYTRSLNLVWVKPIFDALTRPAMQALKNQQLLIICLIP